ncbi:hypothetical protein MAPG_00130 [Magnaporthiopsis poae ATCC 64411]|uniref:Uncharacterized protein n=1 Tax=Magnaporthiopsis poae (strain ATCC 64411 / 73-15) TaxID=644358 RepID=A0A0C4DK67_MAGP6|nr:hypothetical protein MAPG_00130 [Magnaporthiopsis poae ATCC 64411]
MDVFCCCFRRQSEQSSEPTPCQPITAETSGDLPSAAQPTTHPSPSSRPQSSRAGAEPNAASQSRSSLRPAPIPGAPLEPEDISQLVIDDSDGGGESPPTKKSKKSRASSTLDFVRTRLRNQGSQDDSLRRQSATTVGSSTEELARRAELRRLMRKRIQEELETDTGEKASQTAASDGPSACAKLPATPSHADRLPGGGPRDKIEFSVVQTVEDAPSGGSPNRKENVPLNMPGCSRTEPRRASCPDHLSPSNEAKVSRTASGGILRDKRNSMPQLSSISSTTPLSLPSMSGSSLGSVLALATSSSDSEKQDTSATGRERQAVAAVVVSGGFSPRDIGRKSCDDSKSKQVEPSPAIFLGPRPHTVQGLYRSRSGSPASNAESTGGDDCGQSPMRTWLRSQDLYSTLRASSDCGSSAGPDVDGPTAVRIPKSRSSCPSLDLQASKAYAFTTTNPSPPVDAVQGEVGPALGSPQAHKGSHNTPDRPGSSAEYVTHLRGGILEDADTATSIGETTPSLGRQLSEGSTGHGTESPCLSRSCKRDSLSSLPSSGKHLPSASATNSNVAPVSPSPRLTAGAVEPGTERANARATGSHSLHPKGNSIPHEDQRSSSPASRLALPGPPRTPTDSPSAFASDSEASSFHRREEELLTIPMRFAESKSRRKPNLHSVSRFKEHFRDEYDEHQQPSQEGEGSQSPSEKPSLFACLHLTVPRKARLDSKVVCTDGETAYPSALESSKYSSMRSIRGSGMSRGSLSAHLDVADMPPSNCQRESAETVWRRAIRAEADERLSLARVSGGHHNIANSNSGTKGHPDSHNPDGSRLSARHAVGLGQSSACDHGQASPVRSEVSGRYESGLRTDLGRSSIAPDGTSGRHSGEAYPLRQAKMLSAVEASEIPRSWARFPSHTREERNGPAGPECDITSRDFAVKTPGIGDGDAGWVTDKDSPASSRRTPLGARIVSGRLGRLLKAGVSKMLPSRSSSRTTGKGTSASPYPSRSHSPDDANLEYPELQIQPNEGAFREMQALEQDIVSLRSGAPRSPQMLADGPGGERSKIPASIQRAFIPDRAGRASNASDNAEEYSTAAEAKTPLTPSASRLQPHPDASTMTAGSSTANSDHFLTPVSRMSPRDEGAPSASWHRSPGMLSVDAFRNDDAASHMSSGTVVKKTQSGTEPGVPENQQRTCKDRSSTQPDPSAPHED